MTVETDSHREAHEAGEAISRRLRVKRIAAQAVLFAEALLPRLLPVVLLVALFLAVTWFGYFRHVPAWLHILTLVGFAVALLGLLVRLKGIAWPDADSAYRMLERRNALEHQAIRVQEDKPAGGGVFAQALWREHQLRMAKLIGSLHTGTPEPDIARYDRHALRAIPVLLVAVAFAFSYSNRGGLLSDVLVLPTPAEAAPDVRIDAWVAPPAHTGRAPIFLTGTTETSPGELSIPQFSDLTVRVTGGSGNETVTYQPEGESSATVIRAEPAPEAQAGESGSQDTAETAAQPQAGAPAGAQTLNYKIVHDGKLQIDGREWAFSVIPDRVPEIAFDGIPKRTVAAALEISFLAKDDYGIQEAFAEIVPVEPLAEGARPLYPAPEYRLDLPRRSARDAKGTTSRNLSEHPLAGNLVRITLVARDAAGQEGRSQPQEMILPARNFFEPLAAAIAEQRQVFALDANQMPRALALNDALMIRPEETIPNLTHFLLLKSARERMKLARDDDQLRAAADYLWEIALGIEDGNLSLADRRLRDAQQALSDALERDAPDEEIAKLMQELREAMQAYMEELARQAMKNGQMQENAQQGQILRQQDLERMLDQIENLARSGSRDQARQMLSEMQRMMNNLQAGRMRPQQGQQSDAMRQQMDKLGELMQKQQQLMDQTFQYDQALRDRMQRGDPLEGEDSELFDQQPGDQGQQQQGEGEQQQGQSPTDQMTAEELRQALKDLKAQQDALGQQLSELEKGLQGMGLDPGKGFGEAGREMEGASDALGQGQGEPAVGSQGRALQALRDGAQEMMNQMQAMGQGQGEGMGVPQAGRNGRDPLGRERPTNSEGPDFGGPTKVPEEIDIQRAREILEEIRRRLGTGTSPGLERDYLERLLGIR
ncbi:MAG: TIGR02302 family protein [Shinella sp.]|nr:TIGR02302 family protein [Shinella sp.]